MIWNISSFALYHLPKPQSCGSGFWAVIYELPNPPIACTAPAWDDMEPRGAASAFVFTYRRPPTHPTRMIKEGCRRRLPRSRHSFDWPSRKRHLYPSRVRAMRKPTSSSLLPARTTKLTIHAVLSPPKLCRRIADLSCTSLVSPFNSLVSPTNKIWTLSSLHSRYMRCY